MKPTNLPLMLTVLFMLTSQCWLLSQATTHGFTHTATQRIDPDCWNIVKVTRYGVYFISVTVDGQYNSNRTSLVIVRSNNRMMFSPVTDGIIASTAIASILNADDVITAQTFEVPPNNTYNRLTVSYVGATYDTHFIATKATEKTKAVPVRQRPCQLRS